MDTTREDSSRSDIRRLLKIFGVKADETIIQYLARNPDGDPLRVRLVLEEISEPGHKAEPLHFSVEGLIRR
jgi:hypothetical protein